MVVEQVPSSSREQPSRLRQRLDAILKWRIWPQRWRPWLARRADELVELGARLSRRGAPPPALQTPEEVALALLEEDAPAQEVDAPAQEVDAPAQEVDDELEPPLPEAEPTAAPAAPPAPAPPAPTRTAVPEVFLHDMRDAMQSQSEELERELEDLRNERRTVFRMLLLAVVITFVFLLIGAALVFAGVIAVGVLSGLVALVPGAGTLILRRMENRIDREKDEADALRERKVQLLQAIQVTLLIEGAEERDRAVTELAGELRTRALAASRAPRRKRSR